jgi:hypothetical protein
MSGVPHTIIGPKNVAMRTTSQIRDAYVLARSADLAVNIGRTIGDARRIASDEFDQWHDGTPSTTGAKWNLFFPCQDCGEDHGAQAACRDVESVTFTPLYDGPEPLYVTLGAITLTNGAVVRFLTTDDIDDPTIEGWVADAAGRIDVGRGSLLELNVDEEDQ